MNNLEERRRLLQIIATSFKWLSYSYTNLYYDLVPTTISGKSVKNKAKVKKVYGNSVVENQLVDQSSITTNTKNDITLTNNGNGSFTVNGTASADTTFTFVSGNWETNHYYLIYGLLNKGVNGSVYWYDSYYSQFSSYQDFIYHPTNSAYTQRRITLFIKNGTQVNFTFYPQVCDLTQAYPFDTPTTLTDKRVQAILNGGYLAYNTGTLKNVDMGEISSEPYNLFDGVLEQGAINNNGQNTTNNTVIRSKNYIKVVGGIQYTINVGSLFVNYVFLYLYDKDKNFLNFDASNSASFNRTFANNVAYVRFSITSNSSVPTTNDIYFTRKGTRTGYAPHQTFSPLSFIYQGNGVNTSKDSMEITDTSYVFTKKSAYCNFNTFEYVSADGVFRKQLTNATTNTHDHDFLHTKYNFVTLTTLASLVNGDITRANQWFYIKDTSTTTPSDLTGSMLYTLATPQVITIPKKRLGIVDLGSLNWSWQDSYSRYYTGDLSSLIKLQSDRNEKANIYCVKYLTRQASGGANANKEILEETNGYIYIRDLDMPINDAATFKTAMSGVYLFYETAADTTDIDTQIGIEAGGSLNTDSDVLPDIDFMMKCK